MCQRRISFRQGEGARLVRAQRLWGREISEGRGEEEKRSDGEEEESKEN